MSERMTLILLVGSTSRRLTRRTRRCISMLLRESTVLNEEIGNLGEGAVVHRRWTVYVSEHVISARRVWIEQ